MSYVLIKMPDLPITQTVTPLGSVMSMTLLGTQVPEQDQFSPARPSKSERPSCGGGTWGTDLVLT